MLSTHERIQRQIFAVAPSGGEETAANVVDHLKEMIRQRFQVTDIPDGYLYFPVEMGGLDLKSPFIGLLTIRDAVVESPQHQLDTLAKHERDAYNRAKALFLGGRAAGLRHPSGDYVNG